MQIQTGQPQQKNGNYHLSDRAQNASKLLVGSLLTLSIAIAPFPVRANQRSPISTPSEGINSNHQQVPKYSELFTDNQAILSLSEISVFSTQAKDLLVENRTDLTLETPSPETNPTETEDRTQSPEAQPPNPFTDKLTGDWGGFRSTLADQGMTFDLEFTQFYQGLVSGAGNQPFEYGGRLDGFVKLDTAKLGLWEGGGLNTHIEYRFGNLPGALGNTFFPTNTAMEFPSESPNTVIATSLYFSQRLGDHASFLIGKINALDLLENDLFFGGWGNRRFMNAVFAAPPSGLVPPVFIGAIANVRLDPVNLSFWVYDPDDRTRDYWPGDLFSNGITFSLTTSYNTQIFKRPTTFSITGIYTTKEGTDFSSISENFRAGIEPSTKQGAYSLAFQFSHLLHLNPSHPRQGWGVFFKGAISDGNPNYVQNSLIAGIGGTGLFRGRELDSFGLGYYYYDLSNALQDTLNPRQNRFGDEQGLEVYYSYAVTPYFYLTADFQYIDPPRNFIDDAFIAGLRANIRF
ncbi:MAG TPA: hypothetical protein DEF27_08175 [Oscillatoriales bacterium UBA8482]|nr:MAG: hypothetical protein AUK43_10465 [Oscillatoriales cyanobacterium CG2_30_40_61]HBW57768.1 hypothetical protein [Oscillatoriales bacterium UBA8482]